MATKKEKTITPTDEQWKFAAEFVRSQSVLKAFSAAYPKHSQKPLHRQRMLAKRQLVQEGTQAAIRELTQDARAAEKLTVEGHMAELRRIRDAAFDDGKFSVARAAEVDRGKCAGFYIERSMNMNVVSSPSELRMSFAALIEQYPQAAGILGIGEIEKRLLPQQVSDSKSVIEVLPEESVQGAQEKDNANHPNADGL